MISFITVWRDCLINDRAKVSKAFLMNMEEVLSKNLMCELIVCDYGSQDNIKEVLKSFPHIKYLEVEYNEDDFINQSKCFNKAILMAKNDIIAPVGTDFILSTSEIDQMLIIFKCLGSIVLRPELYYLDEEGEVVARRNVPYLALKRDIYRTRGWDERMKNWGKEDDDIIVRLRKLGLIEVSVKGFGYTHLYHDRSFSQEQEEEQGENYDILLDNINNEGKNVKNSYWMRRE